LELKARLLQTFHDKEITIPSRKGDKAWEETQRMLKKPVQQGRANEEGLGRG